jgi:flavodoxin
MFKIISLLALVAVIGCASWNCCAADQNNHTTVEEKPMTKKNLGKILIAYYSLDGNTRRVVTEIQKRTDATVHEIKITKEYSSTPMIYWTAWRQRKNLPQLRSEIPDFSSYDLIMIGSPVWWYTISAPVLSFLDKCDFKGKAVVPFATHGGNIGEFFRDFKQKAKNAKVLDGIDFQKVSKEIPEALNEKISKWLDDLSQRLIH